MQVLNTMKGLLRIPPPQQALWHCTQASKLGVCLHVAWVAAAMQPNITGWLRLVFGAVHAGAVTAPAFGKKHQGLVIQCFDVESHTLAKYAY